LAIEYANRNGIPFDRAHRARVPGPEILIAPRGNPATKNHDIQSNIGPRCKPFPSTANHVAYCHVSLPSCILARIFAYHFSYLQLLSLSIVSSLALTVLGSLQYTVYHFLRQALKGLNKKANMERQKAKQLKQDLRN